MRLRRSTLGSTGTFRQQVAVRPNTNYVAGAWIKTLDVAPQNTGVGNLATTTGADSPVQILVEQRSSTNRVLAKHWIVGYTDDSPWGKHSVGFRTLAATAFVRLTAKLSAGSGTVWMDDLWVRQLFRDTVTRVAGSVTKPTGSSIRQRQTISSLGLAFDTTYTAKSNHILVTGKVRNTATTSSVSTDKALRLTFSLPVNAVGWKWGDYARRSRPIAGSTTYGNEFDGLIPVSRYPFASVNDSRSGVAIGAPLSKPSLSRFRYDSRQGLTVSFDLGASRAARNGEASFSFVLYPFAPKWGFRAATADYYGIHSASFTRRLRPGRQGSWFLGTNGTVLDAPLTTADESDAYGLGLHMTSRENATSFVWDDAHGILSAAYTHHWGHFVGTCADGTMTCAMPTYATLLSRLQAAATGTGQKADEARGSLNSALRDQNGRLRYDKSQWGIRFYENTGADPARADWVEAVDRYQVQGALDAAGAAGAVLDALYIDSASGMRTWGLAANYHRRHWALTAAPLTFSYDTGQVALINFFQMYEHLKATAVDLHSRGMFTAVDFNGDETSPAGYYGADQIDTFAFENGLPERAPATGTRTMDSFAMQKRTLARQKPISSLDPKIARMAADGDLTAAETLDIRRRLEQNLFYGIYTGPNKEAPDAWWTSSELRTLYARYSPIAKAINTAGWQPVTKATSSKAGVWLERFGLKPAAGKPLYLALRNETGASISTKVTVELGGTFSSVIARELVTRSNRTVTMAAGGKQATFWVTIPAGTTRVARISLP